MIEQAWIGGSTQTHAVEQHAQGWKDVPLPKRSNVLGIIAGAYRRTARNIMR